MGVGKESVTRSKVSVWSSATGEAKMRNHDQPSFILSSDRNSMGNLSAHGGRCYTNH